MFGFSEKQLYDDDKDKVDPKWGIKPRDFFEQFGTEIMQFGIYNYLPGLENSVPKRLFWVYSLLSKIANSNCKDVIITDVRGMHELKEIKKRGAIFIRIIKPDKAEVSGHITQQEPNEIRDEYLFDTIVNDGTLDELREKVINVWKRIKLYYN